MNGYTGKILHINLSNNEIFVEEPNLLFYRKYLGGAGFVTYYLLKEIPQGADALGIDNVIVFACGPFTGMPIAGSGRNVVGAKSPLTNGLGEAEVGGYFGAELRRAGFDAIVIKGKSESPVYLWIHDETVEMRSAEYLWGTETKNCQQLLREELGDDKIGITMIGAGGEKMVRFACVINDVTHAAGRTGIGAVMGSKNLKAIAVKGTKKIDVADKNAVQDNAKWMANNWKDHVGELHQHGSAGNVPILQHIGALPTRNFSENRFEGFMNISGQTMSDTILVARDGCYACPVRCKRRVEVDKGEFTVSKAYGGPEYETVGAFGSNCGVDDLAAVSKANELCNAYGLDTISTGGMISFAMECFEKDIIKIEDTGGLDLHFGNAASMVELTRQICTREGLGNMLAEGPAAIISNFGEEARNLCNDVKNSHLPMHESRIRHGHAFGYAMSPTGADHMHNFWDHTIGNNPVSEDMMGLGIYNSVPGTVLNQEKVRAYAYGSTQSWIHNIICNCMYVPWSREQLINLINAITGWKTNMWELMKTCERVLSLMRVFNIREGLTQKDDRLPPRFFEPIDQYAGINRQAFINAKALYYCIMGWDATSGIPKKEKLIELDVEWAYEYLG